MKKNKGQKRKEKNTFQNRIKRKIEKIIKGDLTPEELEAINKKTEMYAKNKESIWAEEERKIERLRAMNILQEK